MKYKLHAERDSSGSWIVNDKQGHLVPMVQVFVHADYRESIAKLFAASPDLLHLLETLSMQVTNKEILLAEITARVALDAIKGLGVKK